MLSVLDIKDAFHQVPLKNEDRDIKCMFTSKGTMQWTVMVMGLKNSGAIFQKMMEWILKDLDGLDVYIDDVILGTTGETLEDCVASHDQLLIKVRDRFKEHTMIVNRRNAHIFLDEVVFSGHILKEVKRSPAPDKSRAIQK